MVPSEVESVEAVGVPVLTPRVDIANVRLRFANGCIANLTASRISRDQVRKIRFFQRDAYVSIDYAAQEVEMWRLVPQPGGLPEIEGGKLTVPGDEPLKRELEDFVAAVRDRRAPGVTAANRAAPRWRWPSRIVGADGAGLRATIRSSAIAEPCATPARR